MASVVENKIPYFQIPKKTKALLRAAHKAIQRTGNTSYAEYESSLHTVGKVKCTYAGMLDKPMSMRFKFCVKRDSNSNGYCKLEYFCLDSFAKASDHYGKITWFTCTKCSTQLCKLGLLGVKFSLDNRGTRWRQLKLWWVRFHGLFLLAQRISVNSRNEEKLVDLF